MLLHVLNGAWADITAGNYTLILEPATGLSHLDQRLFYYQRGEIWRFGFTLAVWSSGLESPWKGPARLLHPAAAAWLRHRPPL
jgi:hypothetical protein